MGVELLPLLELLLPGAALIGGILLAMRLVPGLVAARRQAAYDQRVSDELVRLEIVAPMRQREATTASLALVRALHTRHRRGVGGWSVGWPASELRAVWRDGQLRWQIELPKQLAHAALAALRATCPGAEVESVSRHDEPVTMVAVGRLSGDPTWPLGDPDATGDALLRLASLAAGEPDGSPEMRLRLVLRPIPPDGWLPMLEPGAASSPSVTGMAPGVFLDALLNRRSPERRPAATPSSIEREAAARRGRALVGFEVQLRLEVAGTDPERARACLWRLINFSASVGDARQAIAWDVGARRAPALRLSDWEVAQLWQLPGERFDAAVARRQPASAPAPPPSAPGRAITVGETRAGPLRLPLDQLARHLAVVGATGSGKSTLLLNLALGALDTPSGVTVIDPHGDLAIDILARVPAQHTDRVHVLRLADRAHPRAFNFLERHHPDQAQLVTSEFVGLLADLWGRYCGPKMQNYLRHALLTMLTHPEPQTILELVRILTDDDFRAPYMAHLARADDPMLSDWWRTQWPSAASRERDPSIAAVLNKLGAFVAYHSIRNVVGQGVSTLQPRQMMDSGALLVVDLSGVGGDNADLFGAMLISRYYIDAVGRGELPIAQRRPHLLVVDEAQRFATRAIERVSVEGRKFGLALALATQSLGGLNERLRATLVTNAATLALLSPGADDVAGLRRLFAPLNEDDLLGLARHELVLRMPGPDQRPSVYAGRVTLPAAGDSRQAAALVAASDQRDARPSETVREELRRRTQSSRPPVAPLPSAPSAQPPKPAKPVAGQGDRH